ncbi:MAG: AAA family ATPase [Gammaproteobacteria bacterium]|jgi:putative secretion ATPase (PEP-CTERM system associated)|nr:AAA family ATPase [Gammaproteobacteria bacterium]MDH3749511.1 AAA family ATPase [Gammaproteobacteria bacterium]MDH3805733.1 AAA family ATPase [Gammaproteobacteria bacterium]
MSYLDHFKLKEQPFRLTPDPDFLYWSKQHARAKAYMESTIWLADGFVVITGEIGSGKTTLLQSFLTELEDDVVYAVVSQTQLTPTEFLQAVLTEFGFKPFNKRKVELLDMLNMFLIEQYSNGKKVVLVVDEAQNLTRKVLEEIRLMSGIETHKEKVLRIILAGQPELKETLESPNLKQLVQRVRLRFHIGPLDSREMREYIKHRLKVAGCETDDLFADNTYDSIHRYSGGVPRLINTLCDTALLCAFADEKHAVSAEDIMAAVAELNWKEHESNTGLYEKLQQVSDRMQALPTVTQIEVRSDRERLSVQSFPPGRIIVGRSPDNEIYIQSKFVSRHHAQLISDDSGCVLEDLNSTNGVFIAEKQVKKHRLRNGDVISLGVHELVYTDLRQADTASEEELAESDDEASVAGK